jgi:hypothetical protein
MGTGAMSKSPRTWSWIRASTVVSALIAVGLATSGVASGSTAVSTRPARTSRLAPVPLATTPTGALEGVYCPSASNCWAVGYRVASDSARVNEALRWNGEKWATVAVPSPGGHKSGDVSELFAVRCTSAANCWAVGYYGTNTTALSEAVHWNGKHWGKVTVPEPDGTGNDQVSYLIDVACTSAASCWTVGEHAKTLSDLADSGNLMLRWNGKKWSQVTVPDPGGTGIHQINGFQAVRCAAPADCWSAGYAGSVTDDTFKITNEMQHWNGQKWSNVTVPQPGGTGPGTYTGLNGLSCTAVDNCWAVGVQGNLSGSSTYLNEALHWNGKKWSHVKTPEPDGVASGADNELIGVNCVGAKDCWAVGSYQGGDEILNEILHWTGTKWTVTSAPDPGGTSSMDQNELFSVRCVSAADCWTVGYAQPTGNPEAGEILHWTGTKWRTS